MKVGREDLAAEGSFWITARLAISPELRAKAERNLRMPPVAAANKHRTPARLRPPSKEVPAQTVGHSPSGLSGDAGGREGLHHRCCDLSGRGWAPQ